MPDELPEVLYHYTNQSGLLGIFKSKTLWATNLYYLNDSSELHHAVNLVKKMIPIHIELPSGYFDLTQQILDTLEWTELANIFVASFSKDPDTLSQWRAYGSENGGFSIGFNYAKLNRVADHQEFGLKKCVYDEHDQKKTIIPMLQGLARSIDDELKDVPTKDSATIKEILEKHVRDFFVGFLPIAPTFKSCHFDKEEEWRLVSPTYYSYNHPNVQFRVGKSMITPYFKFDLTKETDNLPIDEIIIGPTPHEELSRKSVEQLVYKHGLSECKVNPSKIPFRGW